MEKRRRVICNWIIGEFQYSCWYHCLEYHLRSFFYWRHRKLFFNVTISISLFLYRGLWMASIIIFFYIQEFKSFERNKLKAILKYSEVSRVGLYMIRHRTFQRRFQFFFHFFRYNVNICNTWMILFKIQYKLQTNKKISEKVRTQKIDKKTKTKTVCNT